MCDRNDEIKLCTCADGAPIAPPMWILERRDESLEEHQTRGRVMQPRLTESELAGRQAMLEALREGSCFDFEYEPVVGDVLTIVHEASSWDWRFRVEAVADGAPHWSLDASSKHTGWRSQMVNVSAGPLG